MDESLIQKEQVASAIITIRELVTLCERFDESIFAGHPMKVAMGKTGILGVLTVLGIFALTNGELGVGADWDKTREWVNDRVKLFGRSGFMAYDSNGKHAWTSFGKMAIKNATDDEAIQWSLLGAPITV